MLLITKLQLGLRRGEDAVIECGIAYSYDTAHPVASEGSSIRHSHSTRVNCREVPDALICGSQEVANMLRMISAIGVAIIMPCGAGGFDACDMIFFARSTRFVEPGIQELV